MFAAMLATSLLGGLAQAPSPHAESGAAVNQPQISVHGTVEDLARVRARLPKASKPPRILNSGALASSMDYPADAVRNGEEGTVEVWLEVAADGTVRQCGISGSSGSQALDNQTCDLMIANAKFRPAEDKRGLPVTGLFHQRMTWRLEGRATEFAKNAITKDRFIIGPDAELRSCKSEIWVRADNWVEGPKGYCENLAQRAQGSLQLARERSKLHDAHVVFEARVFADPSEAMPPLAADPGDVLIYVRKGTMSFDESGKRISCIVTESVGTASFGTQPCENPTLGTMPAPLLATGVPRDNVRFAWAVYLKDEPN